jgi:hypothetical protein
MIRLSSWINRSAIPEPARGLSPIAKIREGWVKVLGHSQTLCIKKDTKMQRPGEPVEPVPIRR